MDNQTPIKPSEAKATAGAAGVGGGTLLVLLANQLPENNTLKPWLLIIAPSLSVSLSVLWLWAQIYIMNWLRDREAEINADKAKATLESLLQNDNTSEEHKKRIRSYLEQVETAVADRHMKRINVPIVEQSAHLLPSNDE